MALIYWGAKSSIWPYQNVDNDDVHDSNDEHPFVIAITDGSGVNPHKRLNLNTGKLHTRKE